MKRALLFVLIEQRILIILRNQINTEKKVKITRTPPPRQNHSAPFGEQPPRHIRPQTYTRIEIYVYNFVDEGLCYTYCSHWHLLFLSTICHRHLSMSINRALQNYFNSFVVFHCICVSYLNWVFIDRLECCHDFILLNSVVINSHVHISLLIFAIISLECSPASETAAGRVCRF